MDLVVAIDPPSAAVSTCFVSLPASIARPLLRDEGVHELVVSVTVTPSRHQTPRLVSWAGDVSGGPTQLGIHADFASCIGLTEGQRVLVEAVRHDAEVAGAVVSLVTRTEADYAAVSSTAEFVEAALLQQIRVVFPGLMFPLRLPGRRILELEVVLVGADGGSPDFLYLHAGVEVTILAPDIPVVTPWNGMPFTSATTLRALPTPIQFLGDHSVELLVSLDDDADDVVDARHLTVFVQRAVPSTPSTRSLPVRLLSARKFGVAPGHTFVPPHIWWELGLSSLAALDIQVLDSKFIRQASAELCLLATTNLDAPVTPDEALLRAPAILYPGMPVGEGEWIVGFRKREPENLTLLDGFFTRQPHSAIFSNDYDSLRSSVDEGGETDDDDANSSRAGVNAQRPAWSFRVGDEMVCEELHSSARCSVEESSYQRMFQSWPPESQSEAVAQVLQRVRGVSARSVLQRVVQHLEIGALLNQRRVFLLRGGEGSGKTLIARAAAALLRHRHPLVHTVWIRWRAHVGEPVATSVRRIESAASAARQCAPALLVFDDVDVVASSDTSQETPTANPSDVSSSAARAHAIASCVASCFESNANVSGLLLSGTRSALDNEVVAPGLVTCTETISGLSAADRATIMDSLLRQCAVETGAEDVLRGQGLAEIDVTINSAVKFCDGFGPGDIQHVVQRALIMSRSQGLPGGPRQFCGRFLIEAAKATVPRSQLGISFENGAAFEVESWESVGGLWHAKVALRETFELPAQNPKLFDDAPVRIPSGVLLYGPPGTGKSLLATVASRACGMRSITIKGPELLSKYIGESEAEVRKLFLRASALAPCVVIFDEFDALAPRRGGETTGVADRVVNTLLTTLDGVEGLRKGVFVVATSSHPELIDPAVLRPGRIDRWVPVDFPDEQERTEIVECLWRDMRVCESATSASGMKAIASATAGMSGADIRGVLTDVQLSFGSDAPIALNTLLSMASSARPSVSSRERERYRRVMDMFGRRQGQDTAPILDGKSLLRVALQ
jgi:SpoVK/Ycf46/Vps4 family AAA+-type ATPase